MKDARQVPIPDPADEITLASQMKGMLTLYVILVIVLVGVEVVGFRGAAIAGSLRPTSLSNPLLLSFAIAALSFLALVLGFGLSLLRIATTAFSVWGIRRSSWLGGLAIPWEDILQVEEARLGMRFRTQRKSLFFPVYALDSEPSELFALMGNRLSSDVFSAPYAHKSKSAT